LIPDEAHLTLTPDVLGVSSGIPDKDRAWQAAKDRKNVLIFTRFTDLRSKAQFAVATYHMPCMFYLPPAMVIHAALAVQRTQVWHKILLHQWHLIRHWHQLMSYHTTEDHQS
jgi:hypothetical protein